MKLLSLTWYKVLPALYGGQKGIANFNQSLGKFASLVCLCSSNNKPLTDLSYRLIPLLPTGRTQFFDPRVSGLIRKTAEKEEISHVILEHPYHVKAALELKKHLGCRIIVHSHNIESIIAKQNGKWWWPLVRRMEKKVYPAADLCIFKTVEDRDLAIGQYGINAEKTIIIPYCIERPGVSRTNAQDVRKRLNIPEDEIILLFAGTIDYKPNAEAVADIYKKLAPLLDSMKIKYRIIICGRNVQNRYRHIQQLHHPCIMQVGEVNNINDYLLLANVFINPVCYGGGMQTKNIDAIAADLNVVLFDHMKQGLDESVCGDKIFAAEKNDWKIFAEQVIKAAANHTPTPDRFFMYYSFDHHTEKLVSTLNSG